MRWRNKASVAVTRLLGIFVFAFSVQLASLPAVFAMKLTVRTPAKVLDGRFRIMVQVKFGKMKYVMPFWVDPTEKISVLDQKQFKELAFVGNNPTWDEVSISGYALPVHKFKNGDTEDAFLPDYVKSCCYGVIGQDILKLFQVVAFDDVPAYIEWYRLEDKADKPSWFVREKKYLWETQAKKIFNFKLLPPERRAFLTERWNGVPSGTRWLRIQGKDPQYIDKYLLEKYLKGRVDQLIELEFQVGKEIKKIVHEFKWKT